MERIPFGSVQRRNDCSIFVMDVTCSCGKRLNEADHIRGECYRCSVSGIGFTFTGGGGYGRHQFHESTLAEAMRENDVPGSQPRS